MENQEGADLKPDEEISDLGNLELDDDIDYDTLKEKYDDVIKKSKTLFAQKEHFKTKFQKASEQKREETPQINKKDTVDPDDDIKLKVNNLELAETKRAFGYENNLSPKETDYVFRFAGNSDPKQALEDPFIKAGIEAMRSEEKVKNATPSSGGSSGKFTPPKIGDKASESEKQDAFQKFMSKKLGNG